MNNPNVNSTNINHSMLNTANTTLCVPSPAKLNLFLHITGQRDNGYHELQTIFQLIDLYDDLYFQVNQSDAITLSDGNAVDVAPDKNLIYRAAQAIKPFAQLERAGCEIRLDKRIPMGAGLGGGSSNAATTLLILNELWQCQLTENQLIELGTTLGADVPIFIVGKNAWAEGIGEIITPLEALPSKQYVIIKPDCFISTQALFSEKTLTRNTKPSKFAAYQQNTSLFGNNFESLARSLYPEVETAFQYLNQYGQARLTGTGACVFLELADDVSTEQIDAKNIARHAPYQAYIAHGINHSPVFDYIQRDSRDSD